MEKWKTQKQKKKHQDTKKWKNQDMDKMNTVAGKNCLLPAIASILPALAVRTCGHTVWTLDHLKNPKRNAVRKKSKKTTTPRVKPIQLVICEDFAFFMFCICFSLFFVSHCLFDVLCLSVSSSFVSIVFPVFLRQQRKKSRKVPVTISTVFCVKIGFFGPLRVTPAFTVFIHLFVYVFLALSFFCFFSVFLS